jgi:hypothetical protein
MKFSLQLPYKSVDDNVPNQIEPSDVSKLIKLLRKEKACRIDGIPNECLRHLPRRPLVHLTRLFNHCICLSYFLEPWKVAKIITLPKPGEDPKFPQNLRRISLLSTTGKVFDKGIYNVIQKYTD